MFELPDTFSDKRRHPRALFSGDELIPCYWILDGKTHVNPFRPNV